MSATNTPAKACALLSRRQSGRFSLIVPNGDICAEEEKCHF
jgi:hypothetical protein